MARLIALSAFAVACISLPSFAGMQPPPPSGMTQQPVKPLAPYNLTCQAATGPSAYTHTLQFTNNGPGTVLAGTTMRWAIGEGPSFNAGSYTFSAALPPNQSVFVANALPKPVRTRMPCSSLFNANQA